jgi:hypothetical protein
MVSMDFRIVCIGHEFIEECLDVNDLMNLPYISLAFSVIAKVSK